MNARPRPDHDLSALLGVARTGRIVDRTLMDLRRASAPGVSSRQLDQIARTKLAAADARPAMLGFTDEWSDRPFASSVAVAVNNQITGSGDPEIHLVAGDLITLDLVAEHRGWHADAAASFVVPGASSDPARTRDRQVLAAAAAAVTHAGIGAIRPGRAWSEVVAAMAAEAHRLGVMVLRGFDGHGIGRRMHAPPRLPTHPLDLHRAGPNVEIRPGMIVAIEPVIAGHDPGFVRSGWSDRTADGTDACYAEATVAVGESRNLVLCGGF